MPIEHLETLRDGQKGDSIQVVEPETLSFWDERTEFDVVGRPHTRLEGPDKVTGRARYAYDMRLPNQLYARILRCPHPHARLRRIDTRQAEALPGVHAVLSSANARESSWYKEEVGLFSTTLRYVGDEVAAVAAESEEITEDALRLIEVDYEPLPFVTNMEQAQQPGAPLVHEDKPGNLVQEPQVYKRGDPEAGLAEADVVIDQVYTTQTALHNCLEPHGCTADWRGDELTLYESTQGIFEVREMVANKLGLAEHHVRVIKHHMGGGFGSKQIAWKQTVIAALLSKQTGRPVQLMLDREAENLAAGNRNPTIQHVRLGAKRDGTLTAIVAEIQQAVGAYMVGGEASNTTGTYERLYRCANVRTEKTSVYTHTGPSVAFRAPGYVEGTWGLELAMDELARALDLDPLELRLRSYTEEDQKKGQPFSSPHGLRRSYERVAEAFGWHDFQRPPAQGSKRRGVGFAAHEWGGAGHPPGYAWVKLNSDGTADVVTGTQDIGTGTRTGLAIVAAEELGLPVERVSVHLGDTAMGPYSPTSAGSATMPTLAPAVRQAAVNARQLLLKAAAMVLEEEPGRLRVRDGQIFVAGDSDVRVSVAEVTGRIAPTMIQGHGSRGPNPPDLSVRTFGAQIAEVEVDLETGEVTLLRVVAAHDCGRIINPKTVDSQVIGGVTQGIGFALTEERIVDDKRGFVLNPNLEEYKIPTVADVPPIVHAAVDLPDIAANPAGVKGIGEPPLVPTAPAIANAIFDATGARLREAPISRHRLIAALAEHASPQGGQR